MKQDSVVSSVVWEEVEGTVSTAIAHSLLQNIYAKTSSDTVLSHIISLSKLRLVAGPRLKHRV